MLAPSEVEHYSCVKCGRRTRAIKDSKRHKLRECSPCYIELHEDKKDGSGI